MSSKKTNKLGQEELLAALSKKRECNKKAQLIVESLLESTITQDEFLSKLNAIDQTHYDDIVEERSILFLCGYPLCSNKLSNIPTKQFQISVKSNTVYDITERKKFCSGRCFKASNYIRVQILTSPLWARDLEKMPQYQILIEK